MLRLQTSPQPQEIHKQIQQNSAVLRAFLNACVYFRLVSKSRKTLVKRLENFGKSARDVTYCYHQNVTGVTMAVHCDTRTAQPR